MELKAIAILILSVSATWGFALEKAEPRAGVELGETIRQVINNVTAGLADPLTILDLGDQLEIDLAELLATLNPNITNIKGKLKVGPTILAEGLSKIEVGTCSLISDGILNPLPFDIGLDFTSITIRVGYAMDALVSSIIPIRGAGDLTVNFAKLGLGFSGNLLNPLGTLTLGDFKLGHDISTLKLYFSGLLGDEALSEELNAIIGQIIGPSIEPILAPGGLLDTLTPLLNAIISDAFNALGLQLSDLLPKP